MYPVPPSDAICRPNFTSDSLEECCHSLISSSRAKHLLVADHCRIWFSARSRQHQIGIPSATVGPSGQPGRQIKVLVRTALILPFFPIFCCLRSYSYYHHRVHCNDLLRLACYCLRWHASDHVCRPLEKIEDARQRMPGKIRALERGPRRTTIAPFGIKLAAYLIRPDGTTEQTNRHHLGSLGCSAR